MADLMALFRSLERQHPVQPITHLLVGLGNPGTEYERTRHNCGYMALDAVAKAHGITVDRVKFHATVGEGIIGGVRTLLMKPTTYMNNSGLAVGEAAAFYHVPPEHILVLHDEISFDVGVMRIRRKGSAGGHNGLKSLIASLGSDAFPRIKIGIGKKPSPDYDLADYVLGRFSPADLSTLSEEFTAVTAACECILAGDVEGAMARYSH